MTRPPSSPSRTAPPFCLLDLTSPNFDMAPKQSEKLWLLQIWKLGVIKLPRQQKINEMNGAHLASPIRGELGYAHWPQLGTQFIANKMFALTKTAAKFLFSNSGNFRAKANPPKPRSCPKRPFGQ